MEGEEDNFAAVYVLLSLPLVCERPRLCIPSCALAIEVVALILGVSFRCRHRHLRSGAGCEPCAKLEREIGGTGSERGCRDSGFLHKYSSRSPVLHYEEGAAAMAEHPAQYCVVRESGAKGEGKGKRCGGDEAGGREFAEGRGEIT